MNRTLRLSSKCNLIVMNIPGLEDIIQPPRTSMLKGFTIVSILAVVSLFIYEVYERECAGKIRKEAPCSGKTSWT